MDIEKYKSNNWFYYYYIDSQTNRIICHGLYNDYSWVGYNYHNQQKGFWLR